MRSGDPAKSFTLKRTGIIGPYFIIDKNLRAAEWTLSSLASPPLNWRRRVLFPLLSLVTADDPTCWVRGFRRKQEGFACFC